MKRDQRETIKERDLMKKWSESDVHSRYGGLQSKHKTIPRLIEV